MRSLSPLPDPVRPIHPICPTCGGQMTPGGVIIDLERNQIVIDGRRIALSPTQVEVAAVLHELRPRVVSRDFLVSRIYGVLDAPGSSKIIDVFVCHLRHRLLGTRVNIITQWGRGWEMRIGRAP